MKVLVLVEHGEGAVKDATLATITAAAQLGTVHALVAGEGEHAVAELGHEGLLDLVLGAAGVDLALDEGALAVGLGGLGGERQRRAAHRAHHLVLHVGQSGPGAVGGQRGRGGGQ